MPPAQFADECNTFYERTYSDTTTRADRAELIRFAAKLFEEFGLHAPDEAKVLEWLSPPDHGCQEDAPVTREQFAHFARMLLEEVASQGCAHAAAPSTLLGMFNAEQQWGHSLHEVKLDASQYSRLPEGVPLRVFVGIAEFTDRWFEPNEDLMCEVRLYPPQGFFASTFFHESSCVGTKSTASVKGETAGVAGTAYWFFGEELTFDGEEVSRERHAEGALQAQVFLSRPTGEKLAGTGLLPVPTESQRREPLWTRAMFSRNVGQVLVAAGWIGPDMVGWLAAEVSMRANLGKWTWVAETLKAMGAQEVQRVASGKLGEDGWSVLMYASMSAAVEPAAAEAVEMLLAAKADPCVADKDGLTAAHYAAFAGADASLASLLGAGADCSAAAEGGVTPLMLAALVGHAPAVQVLLSAGAPVATVDADGLTAAVWVCMGCEAADAAESEKQGQMAALLNKIRRKASTADMGRTTSTFSDTGANANANRSTTTSQPDRRALMAVINGLWKAAERGVPEDPEALWQCSSRPELLGLLTRELLGVGHQNGRNTGDPTDSADADAEGSNVSKGTGTSDEGGENVCGSGDAVSKMDIEQVWLPLAYETAKPGPAKAGCYEELYDQVMQQDRTILGRVLREALLRGAPYEELCRTMLQSGGDFAFRPTLEDGRTLVEIALDLQWNEVALLLCDRNSSLQAGPAAQARAMQAAVAHGHKELVLRLTAQWGSKRDAWERPSPPASEGLAECPVCFVPLALSDRPPQGAGAFLDEAGHRVCPHHLCLTCSLELERQNSVPKCPICRHTFKPPAEKLPDPLEDPIRWFEFVDESRSGYLERQTLEQVLPAVVPVDVGRLVVATKGPLWKDWDPAEEGKISVNAFCSERGLLRWLAEHIAEARDERLRGTAPNMQQDAKAWFQHWARPGDCRMGKAEVLRVVLKTAGVASLDFDAVAANRQWVEEQWGQWDRNGDGDIDLDEFFVEKGLRDCLLQWSALATAKRAVSRMSMEQSDHAALVSCCQQIVECAVGIAPEDPPKRWAQKARQRLVERAVMPVREDYEATLAEAARQVVASMQRNQGSAKLFAWCCRALGALSFAPFDAHDPSSCENALEVLLDGPATNGHAPVDSVQEPLWRLVTVGFVKLLPEHQGGAFTRLANANEEPAKGERGRRRNSSSSAASPTFSPGALREAGLCAVCALRLLVDRAGPSAGDQVFATLATSLTARCNEKSGAKASSGPDLDNAGLAALAGWLQGSAGFERASTPGAQLMAWVGVVVSVLTTDSVSLVQALLNQEKQKFASSIASYFASLARGLNKPIPAGFLQLRRPAAPVRRPPTTASLAARLVQALLAGFQSNSFSARSCLFKDGPDHAYRTRTRDGRLAVGDAVRMNPSLETVRHEQEPAEHFGGWCDRMAFCLDFPGRIVEIPRRAPRMPEVLRISHGAMGCWCWNVSAVLEVIPDTGLLPFEEAGAGPGVALTIGDEVRIAVSVEEAKALQVNHGGWNERMSQCCGKVGRLEAIDKAGDMKILVPGIGAFVWNAAALQAPQAQWWESALRERLRGPLEGTLPLAALAALSALGSRLDDEGLRKVFTDMRALRLLPGGNSSAATVGSNSSDAGTLKEGPSRETTRVAQTSEGQRRSPRRVAREEASLTNADGCPPAHSSGSSSEQTASTTMPQQEGQPASASDAPPVAADQRAATDAAADAVPASEWTSLLVAALVIDLAAASRALEEVASAGKRSKEDDVLLPAVARPGAIAICRQEHLGDLPVVRGDVGLLQAMQAWWDGLPPSEKRARSV